MRLQPLRRKAHEFFVHHWFITTLLITIPAYYFILFRVTGKTLGLIAENGLLTPIGLFLFCFMFGISLLTAFVKASADNLAEYEKYNGQEVLKEIGFGLDRAKDSKRRRFVKYIDNHHKRVTRENLNSKTEHLDPFNDITQPERQTEILLDSIRETFSDLFDISIDNIGMSILYKFDNQEGDLHENWRWLHSINVQDDLSLYEIISSSNSAARQIIDNKTAVVFYPDKRIAAENVEYVMGNRDDQHENVGSVLCKDISVGHDNRYVHAILNITTYGTQVCEQQDREAKRKILNVILPSYEKRLRLELSLLYIKEVLALA